MIEWNQAFIIAAYSVAWVVILGYLARLVRKGSQARGGYDRMLRGQGGGDRR